MHSFKSVGVRMVLREKVWKSTRNLAGPVCMLFWKKGEANVKVVLM